MENVHEINDFRNHIKPQRKSAWYDLLDYTQHAGVEEVAGEARFRWGENAPSIISEMRCKITKVVPDRRSVTCLYIYIYVLYIYIYLYLFICGLD